MNDETARALLNDAIKDARVGAAPATELVRRGVAARRRHRLTQVGAVVAAVAAVIVGVGAVADTGPGRGTDRSTAQPPAGSVESPTVLPAPEGMRYVGMHRVVVAVPADWGTNQVGCDGETAIRDTVVFDADGSRGCEFAGVKASSVHLADADTSEARAVVDEAQATPGTTIDGADVYTVPIQGGTESRPYATAGLYVPGEDTVIWIESLDVDLVQQILDSVRVVPSGYVAIPYDAGAPLPVSTQRMEQVGLDVRVVEEPRPGLSPGTLLSTDPLPGTPVREGSTVTLTVAGQDSDPGQDDAWPPTGPDVERPAAIRCVYFYPDDLDAWRYAVDATVTKVELGPREEGVTPATVTLRVHNALRGDLPATVQARAFDAGMLLPDDPQDAVGVRIITTLGRDLSLPACGFTRPWSIAELEFWAVVLDSGGADSSGAGEGSSGGEPLGADRVTEADRELAQRLHDLAVTLRGGQVDASRAAVDAVDFADEVGLGLAGTVYVTMPLTHVTSAKTDLSVYSAWRVDGPEGGFRERDPGFNALDHLRTDPAGWRLSTGPHGSCPGPVVEPSGELAGLRQLSIQPADDTVTSCIDWWSVDVFMDDEGVVQAVTLDLGSP